MNSTPALAGARLLIVDDEPSVVQFLIRILEPRGAVVLAAYSAEAALDLLDEHPDLALLDVNLGETDGFILLSELRERTTIPVIILTGRGDVEDAVHGLSIGADDYMRKPFSVPELLARIQARLRRS